jgi:site-specific DNA-methyltransferase (adenine-specific)
MNGNVNAGREALSSRLSADSRQRIADTRSPVHSSPWGDLITGDCLDVLRAMPPAFVDLAYFDPPFNTGKTQVAANAKYPDRWESMREYLAYMRPRVEAICRALKSGGSLLLHCDWRTCHHFRLMLDEILGEQAFINHLIWSYGLGGSSPKRFARKHDDILYYAMSDDYYFVPPMVRATSNRMKGMCKKASDVICIPAINNMAAERVGFPTQKPIKLLAMLIGACSPPGGTVLDAFCGSGTTCLAAAQLGRRFVGIDVSQDAIDISRRRCAATRCKAIGQ